MTFGTKLHFGEILIEAIVVVDLNNSGNKVRSGHIQKSDQSRFWGWSRGWGEERVSKDYISLLLFPLV